MLTPSETIMAEHEAASRGKDWLLVRQQGWQPGFGTMPGRMLWNVVAGSYGIGSTITLETVLAAGWRVEVVL